MRDNIQKQEIVNSVKSVFQKRVDYCNKWLEKMDFLQSVTAHENAVISLFDASRYRFIYFNDRASILGGYNPGLFTCETGLDFSFSNMHPEQRSAGILVQLKVLSYGMENPGSVLNNTVANMIFPYKKQTGEYIQYLQKGIAVEADSAGNPVLYLRYGYDITHLVKPSVGLIINSPEGTHIWQYQLSTKSLEQIRLLSTQEKKILMLLGEGKLSKEIAEKLFLSIHTVDTHRRNLLKKTNCIDTTALITFAKLTGLL